jgi:aminoglycoside phosphotransferase (APT) family kinase protein
MIMLMHTESPAVASALRDYLRSHLGLRRLRYRQAPEPVPDGFEAYTYRFQLAGHGLPAELRPPLALRLYASEDGLPILRREAAAQANLHGRGFPVPRPVLAEEDAEPLGGPFMIMDWVPGRPMVESMFRRFWQIFYAPFQMGALHARLHNLPLDDFPAPERPYLTRWLEILEDRIDEFDLLGLLPGLRWLDEHRPPDPERPSILHLDFHPINLLYQEGRIQGVLDWPEVDVGDPHADVATTLVLIETTQLDLNPLRRVLSWPGRILVRRFYLRAYGFKRRINWPLLRYYKALAGLRRLSRWGMWMRESPSVSGCKPTALRLMNGKGIRVLEDQFYRNTGISIRLRSQSRRLVQAASAFRR